jgi:hypothetical protein
MSTWPAGTAPPLTSTLYAKANRKKWKISFFVMLTIFIASNFFWAYQVLDQGITVTYHQVTIEDQKESIEVLGNLIKQNSINLNQKDILYLLRKSSPDAFIVEEGPSIILDGLKFEFSDGKLVRIYQQ